MRTIYGIVGLVIGMYLLPLEHCNAQRKENEEDNFTKVTTFGLTTNTNAGVIGGLSFRQTKLLAGTLFGMPQARYFSVEVVNVKHPKEIASLTNSVGSRFIEGKENYLFVLRPQYGREIKLFQRDADEGVAVSGILAAGPSIGIIKPYFLEVTTGNFTRTVPASQVNGYATATGETVTGSGGFFQGFDQSKLTVGLNVKAALSFELSAFRNNTTGIEVGFLAEIFPNKIIIIPNTDPARGREEGNRSFFTSGYITLFFGSKK